MPTYEFYCKPCDKKFATLVDLADYDETGEFKDVLCPCCKRSDGKTKVMSGFAFAFSNPVGTDRWNSDSKGHGYRFDYNKPNVRAQREYAEANSHMGGSSEIYNEIDDLNNDAAWREPT